MTHNTSSYFPKSWAEIKLWRGRTREALIAQRIAVATEQRRAWNETIGAYIEAGFPMLTAMTIGFCWPFKNEFDARFVLRRLRTAGAVTALPAVIAPAAPLQFRKWWPGAPMTPGVYGIPVPVETAIVTPDAALIPLNGFDEQGYRLGYGGGYFDRTLAAAAPRPLAIGVGYELARLKTIYPQPHDIALDFVVTEAGLHVVSRDNFMRISDAECRLRARQLCTERGLPHEPRTGGEGFVSPRCYAAEFPDYFRGPEDD